MRVKYIDFFRTLAIINMVIYHTLYDLKYIFLTNIPYFSIESWHYYQQYICISFIFLSGISANYSKHILKNTTKLAILSLVITILTTIISDELAIYFGVIHFLSISTFLLCFFKKLNIKNKNMFFIFFTIFIFTKSSFFTQLNLGKCFEQIPLSFVLGFPKADFYSSDYFPIIPWIFLSLAGYFFDTTKLHEFLNKKVKNIPTIFTFISQKSLIIYALHQVVIYGFLYIIL